MTSHKPRILVVDDTVTNIQVLVPILMSNDEYEINIANNGRQALELMEKVKPDLVLLDIMMPELDGYETCKIMKESPALCDIPVIFLTAKSDVDDLVQAFDVGGADYVKKPFNSHELMSRVKTQLELKGSNDLIKEHVIALAETEEKLRQKINQMEAELERARVIQKMLLPEKTPEHPSFNIAYRYIPMEAVGGDYICFPHPYEDEQGYFIGALTGHGDSAALYMTLIKFVTDHLYPTCAYQPKALLENLNEKLQGQMPASFFTAIYGVFMLNEENNCHKLTLAGAAHPRPALYDPKTDSWSFIELKSSAAIGILPDFTTENLEILLPAGSRLLLYTDGVTETLNLDEEILGEERFLEIINNSHVLDSVEDSLDAIMVEVQKFRNSPELTDDLTLLLIDII